MHAQVSSRPSIRPTVSVGIGVGVVGRGKVVVLAGQNRKLFDRLNMFSVITDSLASRSLL